MSYVSDPLEQRMSQFLQQDGASYSFSPPRSRIKIDISEDEYYEAKTRIKAYSRAAKILTVSIGLLGAVSGYWSLTIGSSSKGFFAAIGALFITATLGNFLAITLALRPLTSKFLVHRRKALRWRRKGLAGAIRDLGMLKPQFAIVAAIGLVLLPIGIRNYLRRSAIFDHGTLVPAQVYRSDSHNAKGTCVVRYAYSWSAQTYDGSIVGCAIMERHPVGSTIPVRIIPEQPGYSVAEGERFWTADFAAPFIIIGLFALPVLGLLLTAYSYAPRKR